MMKIFLAVFLMAFQQCALCSCATPPAIQPTSRALQLMWNLEDLVPEVEIEGWNCGHSPGSGSCFVTSANFILRIILKCNSCLNELSQPSGSNNVIDSNGSQKCINCIKELQKEAPTCSGKFLGIGSGKKGHSCKLIDGKGCWPLRNAPVLHDCGAGKECRFKVSKAKAKIWCCRSRRSCKWYQAKCNWQNTFRCSNSALSKSKDKHGAEVLWQ